MKVKKDRVLALMFIALMWAGAFFMIDTGNSVYEKIPKRADLALHEGILDGYKCTKVRNSSKREIILVVKNKHDLNRYMTLSRLVGCESLEENRKKLIGYHIKLLLNGDFIWDAELISPEAASFGLSGFKLIDYDREKRNRYENKESNKLALILVALCPTVIIGLGYVKNVIWGHKAIKRS